MKVCNRCKKEKSDSEFRIRVEKRSPNCTYLNSECMDCDVERARIYYNKHKDNPDFKKKNADRARRYINSEVGKIRIVKTRKTPEYAQKHAEWNKVSYHRVKDRVKARMKIKRQTPEYKAMMRAYRLKNKEKIYQQEVITKKRYSEKHKNGVTDEYVKNKLVQQGLAVTPEIIEAKRLQILIKRKINNYGKD